MEMENFPGWRTMLSIQFENLVLKNRKKIWEILKIKSSDIVLDNPFFQRKTGVTSGCQIDYLIQTRFNTLFACEVKFSQTEINPSIIQEMREKLTRLSLPRRFSCWPVLIHVNGVEEGVLDRGYFTKVIDFSQLLQKV